jgi:asparagine synthase (glutamine-hydrolysing)
MSLFLSNYLLSSQGDRMAMAHSLEIRVPYLDHRVIELAAHFPARWKVFGLKEKHLLKQLYSQTLPSEIANRPKHPYRAPISQSLLLTDDSPAREMLSDNSVDDCGLFDSYRVSKLLQKIQNLSSISETDEMALVAVLSTQWLHRWYIKNPVEENASPMKFSVFVDNRMSRSHVH